MSKEQFENIKAQIMDLSDKEVKTPNMPVDTFVQEAYNLHEWAKEDKKALTKAGLDPVLLDTLPARADALRHAQSVWIKEQNLKKESQKEWAEQAPIAYELKNDLEADFRFAFRAHPELLKKVQNIEEGYGHADMIQDLSDLSVLGSANKDLLKKIGHDLSKLELASEKSNEMGLLLAQVNGHKTEGNTDKVLRDRTYSYAKAAVDEVRDTGRYVFRKDKQKLKGYQHQYFSR